MCPCNKSTQASVYLGNKSYFAPHEPVITTTKEKNPGEEMEDGKKKGEKKRERRTLGAGEGEIVKDKDEHPLGNLTTS